ncbi:hypothetical protein [Desulfosporosinus youngiae]|uniref:Uncharacterized protein n=1 Tax=Desulfosporosinus youngiae DSM 17734 TaxID=768710 RepID=H5XU90_9FIRM|nr:hypothetical protein [Desulfosporosinus youngiae]EHQ89186.1 hypothetical protein DesyoDRAFT_2093 [Desulfosporosinus youngiae DSM 17734]
MNKQELASLACKILGICVIIQGINVFSNIIMFIVITPSAEMASGVFLNTIFSLVYILFGVLLWIFSDKLSAIMVRGESQLPEGSGLGAKDIQRVAFSVLGLYFMGSSLPNLLGVVTSLIREQPMHMSQILFGSVGMLARLIIGLGIFLGSEGLVNFLAGLRRAGVKREDTDSNQAE